VKCGVVCSVSGVWCLVCGVWCVVCGVWCVVCGTGCVGAVVRAVRRRIMQQRDVFNGNKGGYSGQYDKYVQYSMVRYGIVQ